MKKILSALFFVLFAVHTNAQVDIITPASAFLGQTLTTTITMSAGLLTVSSPPNQTSDIWIEQSGNQIFTDYFDITQVYEEPFNPGYYTDSLYTDFSIPSNATPGWYDVHVTTYTPDPFFPWITYPTDNVMVSGFLVRLVGSCPIPTGVNASGMTNVTTDITWDALTADTFRIRYTVDGTTNYQYKDVDGIGGPVSATLTGLTPGTTYAVEMSTQCGGVPSAYSPAITFTTDFTPINCVVPSDLQVANITNTGADVSWTPFVLADTFRLRYAEDGTTDYFYVDVDGAMGSLYTLSGLNPGVVYQVQVSSICSGISSGYSPVQIFTTDVTPVACVRPYGLYVTSINNTSATIGWTPYVSADTFRLRYWVNGVPGYKYLDVNGSLGSTAALSNLQPATTYNIQVGAICNGTRIGYSTATSFTTSSIAVNCIVPFGLSESNTANSSITVSWSPYVAADTFRVRYRAWNAVAYQYKDVSGLGGTVSANLTNLQANTLYNYEVASICVGVSSGYSASSFFTTLNLPISCARPYGLSTSNITNSSALVSWDNLVSADTFRIRYAVNGTSNYMYIEHSGLAGNSVVINNLLPSTTYDYRVSSICSGSSSGYSQLASFTTSSGAVACALPYGLSHSNQTTTTADVSWTPLVTADSFLVRYSIFGTTNYSWKKITGAGGANSTTLTGLTNGASYQWQVRVICNGVPAGMYSVADVFSTLPSPASRLESTETNDHFSVYPNPAHDRVTIRFTSSGSGDCRLLLSDLAGRVLVVQTPHVTEGDNLFEIPVSELTSGVYILLIESGEMKRQQRIVVD